jgi:hypothetical protein
MGIGADLGLAWDRRQGAPLIGEAAEDESLGGEEEGVGVVGASDEGGEGCGGGGLLDRILEDRQRKLAKDRGQGSHRSPLSATK